MIFININIFVILTKNINSCFIFYFVYTAEDLK